MVWLILNKFTKNFDDELLHVNIFLLSGWFHFYLLVICVNNLELLPKKFL